MQGQRTHPSPPPSAISLAAGKGTRMKSDLPKVIHPVGGRAMVCAVVDACLEVGCARVVVIVGHMQDLVRSALSGYGQIVEFVVQDKQLGTGHAVRCAAPAFVSAGPRDPVFVLCGDGPLIRPATLQRMLDLHQATGAAATLATAIIDNPRGYGRIVRDAGGRFDRIVEERDCLPDQLDIREVNPSYYCFAARPLFDALGSVKPNALGGETYITDVPSVMIARGERVEVIEAVPAEDVLSINTPEDLALVDRIYRTRNAG